MKIESIRKKIDREPGLTFFRKKIYKAILEIPKGEVRTYKWVASRVGNPKACRAVGNALNKNPFAPEVPCHRVVCSDGRIGGFAGGVEKKRTILKQEGVEVLISLKKLIDN